MIYFKNGWLYVSCKGKDFVSKKNFLRELGGRWNAKEKAWRFYFYDLNCVLKYKNKFNDDFDSDSKEYLLSFFKSLRDRVLDLKDRIDSSDGLFKSHQIDGSLYLASKRSCILADDPGLGKTFQVLQAIPSPVACPNLYAILITCPASIVNVWLSELQKWRRDLYLRYNISIIKSKSDFHLPSHGEFVIVSFDSIDEVVSDFIPNSIFVIDEVHNLKNKKTNRYDKVSSFIDFFETKWALSGTPMVGSPMDLWNVLYLLRLDRYVFDDFKTFLKLFNGRKKRFGGFDFGRPRYFEVKKRISKVMLRRKKDILGLSHGDIEFIDVPLDSDVIEELNSLESIHFGNKEVSLLYNHEDDLPDITLWSTVAKLVNCFKIRKMLDIVEEYENSGKPIVVFSTHRDPIELLESRPGWRCITGSTTKKNRKLYADMFQRGELSGIGITKAGMEGITLTRASTMLLVSLDYAPGKNKQVLDRINRIGQDSRCRYLILQAAHSLEHRLMKILLKKKEYSSPIQDNSITDGVVDVDTYLGKIDNLLKIF